MFTGQKHRADSDSRGQDVREFDLHPRFRDGCFGRSRGGHRIRRWWLLQRVTRWLSVGAERRQLLHSEHAEHASGLPTGRDDGSCNGYSQWPHTSVASALSLLILTCGLACSHRGSPQVVFDHAYKTFLRGDLQQSQDEAHRECQRLLGPSPEWAWKFRILEAES